MAMNDHISELKSNSLSIKQLIIVMLEKIYRHSLNRLPIYPKIRSSLIHNFIIKFLINRNTISLHESIKNKVKVYKFGSEEIIQDVDNNIFKQLSRPFVAEVKNVSLIGTHAIGVTKEKCIILDTTVPRLNCLEQSLAATSLKHFKHFIFPSFHSQSSKITLAFSMVNLRSQAYFHWLLECLTRLEGLEIYVQKTGQTPVIILDKNFPKWKIESLELAGYSLDNCLLWDKQQLAVEQLVISSFRRKNGFTSPSACSWLRERVLSNLDKDNSNNQLNNNKGYIFISRTKAKSRRIVNENELLESLLPLGFIPYVLEEMSFADQVRLFSRAKIIVAPHGAGLSNMIFAQQCAIIELFGSYINKCFYHLSIGLGFSYSCLYCQPQEQDILVDPKKVVTLISKILRQT